MDDAKSKLLEQVRQQIRLRNYSIRTEAVYAEWVKRYIRFNRYRHPLEMGAPEIETFLTHLAVDRNVAAVTQAGYRRPLRTSGAGDCMAKSQGVTTVLAE